MKTKTFIPTICIAFAIVFSTYAQETSYKIEVKDVPVQKAMIIKAKVPTNMIGQKMGEMFGKLYGYLGQNSITPTGAPFAVYTNFDPNGDTEFELGVPVNTTAQGNEEVKLKEYPAMKVLSTVHIGPYEKTMAAYDALSKHAKDNNLQTENSAWEIYLTDPSQETDPAKYQTIVYIPLKK